MTRLHFVVHGRVQGIGYRWFVVEKAAALSLTGWVRNNPDGTVEAEAEGSAEDVARFAEALKSGHPYARVTRIAAAERPAKGGAGAFEIV